MKDMTCQRCCGLLVRDWDVESRTHFVRCIQCSARPYQVTIRADGLPVGAPLRCVDCKVRPRVALPSKGAKGEDEVGRCAECRELFNAMRRQWKRNRKRNMVAA